MLLVVSDNKYTISKLKNKLFTEFVFNLIKQNLQCGHHQKNLCLEIFHDINTLVFHKDIGLKPVH